MITIRRNPDAAALEAQASADAHHAMLRAARRAAFAEEADPLFFKAQRGEAAMADYHAKVAEIRGRFPYYEGK